MDKKQPWDKETRRRPIQWSMPEAFDVPEPETGTENHEPDVAHGGDHHAYFKRFRENLTYIDDWKQYEQLELLKQRVDLGKVSIPYLRQFRRDLDLMV